MQLFSNLPGIHTIEYRIIEGWGNSNRGGGAGVFAYIINKEYGIIGWGLENKKNEDVLKEVLFNSKSN